jgi:hypothetical protein
MAYMNTQFAPLEAKLARLHEYGQIEFDVLLYHFEPGMKIVNVHGARGRPDAFVLSGKSLGQDMCGRFLALQGHAYRFDGDQYTMRVVQAQIREFRGTRPIESLAAVELSPELEKELTGRCLCGLRLLRYSASPQSVVGCTPPLPVSTTRSTSVSVSSLTPRRTTTARATSGIPKL